MFQEYIENNLEKNVSSQEEILDISQAETIESELSRFSKLYFGKNMNELTKEENHEIDCFGMYGISEWLLENDFEK